MTRSGAPATPGRHGVCVDQWDPDRSGRGRQAHSGHARLDHQKARSMRHQSMAVGGRLHGLAAPVDAQGRRTGSSRDIGGERKRGDWMDSWAAGCGLALGTPDTFHGTRIYQTEGSVSSSITALAAFLRGLPTAQATQALGLHALLPRQTPLDCLLGHRAALRTAPAWRHCHPWLRSGHLDPGGVGRRSRLSFGRWGFRAH